MQPRRNIAASRISSGICPGGNPACNLSIPHSTIALAYPAIDPVRATARMCAERNWSLEVSGELEEVEPSKRVGERDFDALRAVAGASPEAELDDPLFALTPLLENRSNGR